MRRMPPLVAISALVLTIGIPVGAKVPTGLPIASRTPGALNAAVTQATIRSTICTSGYTKTIRPPERYTYDLKVQQLHSGYAVNGDTLTRDYEEDHLISLEIGGNPTSVKNLWPEPWHGAASTPWNASVKDALENRLHSLVCSGQLSLRAAQTAEATNWEAAYKKYMG
jgi:hypothetical protein